MATHKSDLIAAKDSLEVSEKSKFNADRTNATVLQATAVYTFDGTEQTGDVIELADIPAGAIVIPHQSFVADAFPSALSHGRADIRIGHSGSASAYGYLQSLNYGTSRNFNDQVFHSVVPLADRTRVNATFGYLSPVDAGSKLVFGISYAING